jgi:predicted MFS family arabinose efflux permease
MFLRSTFHRGYVLTSSLYFVTTARLSASEIVLLGVVMSATLLLTDIPAGAWADSRGRTWLLVAGQLLLATGMIMTGLVQSFPLLVVTQVLWGLGWAFVNGTDTAWLNDELDDPARIARVLTASARMDLAGGATGMIAFGLLAWVTSLSTAILVSGAGLALLALQVAARFGERHFVPLREKRWSASRAVFGRGITLSRRDPDILLVFAATLLVNAAFMAGWLYPKRLVSLGLPDNPVLWYSALLVLASALGFLALHSVGRRIDGAGVARRSYALACVVGAAGLSLLALAPGALLGGAGVLLTKGIADSVTRPVSVIWVNRRTTRDVRATVHSFLSQAESIGEITGGFALAGIALAFGVGATLMTAAGLLALVGILVGRSRADRAQASRAVVAEQY